MRTFVFLLLSVSALLSAQNPFEAYTLSKQRLVEKDTAGYFYLAEQAYTLAPFNLEISLNYARACVTMGRYTRASNLLQFIADIGFDYGVENDSSFAPLWKQSRFKQIVSKAKEHSTLTASNFAFAVKEKDFIPGGIAYDPRQQKFYLGSIYKRKIVGVQMDGTVFDFIGESQDGLYSPTSMKIDAARNHLWVAGTLGNPRAKGMNENEAEQSAVFQFDLGTHQLIKKYTLTDTVKHRFNDLVLAGGSVYVTDGKSGTIYIINKETQTIAPLYRWEWILFPEGITVSSDQKYLFVAHWAGIGRISIADTQAVNLQTKQTTTLTGIDGLAFYENNLIAVQNAAGPQARVMKFELNKQMDAVTKATVLESQNPLYNLPTTGTVVDDEFYLIANSQLKNFDAQGAIFPQEKLQPTYILKLKLNAKE
ncbi:MAG: hypothetical protein WCW40_04320 [Bacteroidota bacterium]